MTPLEAVAFFDDPAQAQWACAVLMRARPGWKVWRGDDRFWRARRIDWPEQAPSIPAATAGLLNLIMKFVDEGETA